MMGAKLDRAVAWLESRASCHRRSMAASAGSAAVEFAITVPLLVALVIGVADYGTMVNQQAMLEAATRAGAEYARANPGDANLVTNTQNTVTGFTTFSSAVTATVSVVCTCVDNSTPANCNSPNPCAGITNPSTAQTDTRVLQYVSVAATQTVSPLIPHASSQLSVGTLTLSALTVTRTQ